MDTTSFARQCILLHGLSEEDIEQVLALGRPETYAEGDVLAVQGAAADKVFVIVEGTVAVVLDTRQGEHTLIYLGTGQLVGEVSLVDGGPHSATVKAMQTPTRVVAFDRQALLSFCESRPHIGFALMRNVAADLAFKLRHHNLSAI